MQSLSGGQTARAIGILTRNFTLAVATKWHQRFQPRLRDHHTMAKRVFGIVAHIDAGKTTTSERLLYYAGGISRVGNVDSGDTTLDFLPAERERGITINSAAISLSWREHKLFLVDSPGHLDFTFEVQRALRVMDGVVVILDAVSGVQAQTETVWRQADQYSLPRIVFVNKMDRDGADFRKAVLSLERRFRVKPVPIQFPITNSKGQWLGFVDLLTMEAVQRAAESVEGSRPSKIEFRSPVSSISLDSDEVMSNVMQARDFLVEALADLDDRVMERWVSEDSLDPQLLKEVLRKASLARQIVPILCGSSLKNFGSQSLLDAIVDFLPSPVERPSLCGTCFDGKSEIIPIQPHGSLLALAFKIVHDTHRGRLVYLRAFCGQLDSSKVPLFNLTSSKKEMPTALLQIMADSTLPVDHVATGDIFAAVGMRHTKTGDTVSSSSQPRDQRLQNSKREIILQGVPSSPPVISVALEADSLSQEREMKQALDRLLAEDTSLQLSTDPSTGETLLSGMGQLHLEIVVGRLSQILRNPVRASKPRIAHRETILRPVLHEEHYDYVIGSTRLASSMKILIEPRRQSISEDGALDIEHAGDENEVIVPETISATPDLGKRIIDAVMSSLQRGPLLGCPTSYIRAKVLSHAHELNASSPAAVTACAASAVANALAKAESSLLEPVMNVECTVPDCYVGDVISELTHSTLRRGIVEDVRKQQEFSAEGFESCTQISAKVPLEGLMDWATRLRSLSKGRGHFSMEFSSYKPVAKNRVSEILSTYSAR